MERAQAARQVAGSHTRANGAAGGGNGSSPPVRPRARPQARARPQGRHKRLPGQHAHSNGQSPHRSGGHTGAAAHAHTPGGGVVNGGNGGGSGGGAKPKLSSPSKPHAVPPSKLSRKVRGMVANPSTISWSHNPMNSTLKRQQRSGDVLLPQHMVRGAGCWRRVEAPCRGRARAHLHPLVCLCACVSGPDTATACRAPSPPPPLSPR